MANLIADDIDDTDGINDARAQIVRLVVNH